MQQPNKGIISPGLQELMRAQESLRHMMQAGQVSPQGPAGPTLAAQMAQAAAPQVAQNDPSMAPPPLGQEPEGEVANVAQNAGLGAAIQGQQQQQAQQAMMQMAQQQQQAQQQPAMMAGGGIAGLRADNMSHFKEGGVLGFAEGDKVPEPTEAELREASKPAGLLRQSMEKPTASEIRTMLAAVADKAVPSEDVAKAYQDPSRQRDVPDITAEAYQDPSRTRDVSPKVGIAASRSPSVGARPPVAPPAPSAPPPAAPNLASQFNEAMSLAKPMANPDQDKAREAVEEMVKARQAQGVPGGVHLQALLDAQQKRARLSEQDEAGAGGRGLAALFQGMMGRNEGSSVAAHNEREKQRRRLDIAETLADKEKESAIRDVQAATATGNAEKKAAAYEKLAAITQEGQKIQTQLAGQILGLASTNITAAANLESQRLQNISQEKIAAMRERQAAMTHSLPSYEQQLVERLVKTQVAGGVTELAAREAVYKAMGRGNYAAGENAAEKAYQNRAKAFVDFASQNPQMMMEKDPAKIADYNRRREEYADALAKAGTGAPPTPTPTPEQAKTLSKYGLQ